MRVAAGSAAGHVLALSLLLTGIAGEARSAWDPNGTLIGSRYIGGTTFGWSPRLTLAPVGDGGVFVGLGSVIPYDSTGALRAGWTTTPFRAKAILEDGHGGVYSFGHAEPIADTIDALRQSNSGAMLFGPVLVTGRIATTMNLPQYSQVQLASDGSHGAFAVWSTPDGEIRARRLRETGEQLPADSEGVAIGSRPAAAPADLLELDSDGQGGLIVAWEARGPSGRRGLRAQRLDSLLVPQWSAGGVLIADDAVDNATPVLVRDGEGGSFLAWQQGLDVDSATRVRLIHVGPAGGVAPGWPAEGLAMSGPGSLRWNLAIAGDGADGVFVAWSSVLDRGLRVSRVQSDGRRPAGAPDSAVIISDDPGGRIGLVKDGSGGVYAAFNCTPRASLVGLRVARLGPNLAPAPGWIPGGTPLHVSGSSSLRKIVTDDRGGAYVLFTGDLAVQSQGQYLQRIRPDGPAAGTAWCIRTDVDSSVPDAPSIRLEWLGAPGLTLTLLRALANQEYQPIGSITIGADGRGTYDDLALAYGTTYYYRTQVQTEAGPLAIEAIDCTTPPAPSPGQPGSSVARRISLAPPWPNPTTGGFTLFFELARVGGAKASLIDVRGRIVWSRDVGGPNPGRFTVPVELGRSVRPGVYWLRLEHSGERVQKPITLTR